MAKTVKLSGALQSLVATATSKIAWSNTVISALGNSRRVTMYYDSAAGAVNPFLSGTKFLDVGLTGAMATQSGNITSLGRIAGITTRNIVDLSTGSAVLRIEGGSYFLQGTLGLAGSNCDFILSGNLSATDGLAFISGMQINAPEFLASGTGPVAPSLDDDAPVIFEVLTYPVDDNTPVSAGHGYINVRDPNLVFDRPFVASQIGDVRVMRCADGAGVVIGTGGECFRIAPTLLVSNAAINATRNKPVYGLQFRFKPQNRWASFPFRKDFNINTDTWALPPFKLVLKRADMSVIDYVEQYSTRVNDVPGTGRPNNGRNVQMGDLTKPNRMWFTHHMTILWSSDRTKPSNVAQHLIPGVEADALEPHNVVSFDSWAEQYPPLSGNFIANGMGALRVCPKWPRGRDNTLDTTITDQYFINILRDGGTTQLINYGYEPASIGQHSQYMGPGGDRHDRHAFSDVVVRYLSDPTGTRLHGAVPNSEMLWHWQMNYANEGLHYATNLERGLTIPKSKVLNGEICTNDNYYNGGNENYRPDIENNAIRLLAVGASVQMDSAYRDKNGKDFSNQYARDILHNISNASNMVYLSNNALGALEATDSFNGNVLCAFDMSNHFTATDFLTRGHGHYFKHFVENWISATNDPRTFSSSDIETMCGRHLEMVYDAINPILTSGTDRFAIILRKLGMPSDYSPGNILVYDSKAFYIGPALMLAKQSGFYDKMKAYSSKASAALAMMMTCLCKGSVDFFIDGGGRPDKRSTASYHYTGVDTVTEGYTWADVVPATGALDWIHHPDGNLYSYNPYDSTQDKNPNYIEGYNTQHMRAQFVWIVDRFFSELNFPRVAQAVTLLNGWYNTVEQGRIAGTNAQWHYRHEMFGKFKTPDTVGAPV